MVCSRYRFLLASRRRRRLDLCPGASSRSHHWPLLKSEAFTFNGMVSSSPPSFRLCDKIVRRFCLLAIVMVVIYGRSFYGSFNTSTLHQPDSQGENYWFSPVWGKKPSSEGQQCWGTAITWYLKFAQILATINTLYWELHTCGETRCSTRASAANARPISYRVEAGCAAVDLMKLKLGRRKLLNRSDAQSDPQPMVYTLRTAGETASKAIV